MQIKIFNDSPKDFLLVLVTAFAVIYPFVFVYNFHEMSWLSVFFWSIGLIVSSMWHFNTTMHYHIHRDLFPNKIANEIFESICTIPMMISYEEYKSVHMVHHKWVNDPIIDGKLYDPTSTFRGGKDGKEEGFLSYVFGTPIRYFFTIDGPDLHKSVPFKNYKKLVREMYVKIAFLIIYAIIDWRFIPVFLVSMYFAWVFNMMLTYSEHHSAANWQDHTRDSCSCYGKIYNFLTFNSGYHQEHHYRPGAHWTQLPDLKKELPTDRHIVKGTLVFNNNPFTLPFSKIK